MLPLLNASAALSPEALSKTNPSVNGDDVAEPFDKETPAPTPPPGGHAPRDKANVRSIAWSGGVLAPALNPFEAQRSGTALNNPQDLLYSTFLGGSDDEDVGYAIAADASGAAYVAGLAYSFDFPTTPGAFQTIRLGTVFVAKLNPAGTGLIYSTFLNGQTAYGIAVDASGAAYVTGQAYDGFPTTPGSFDVTFNGNTDAFVVKLNAAGDGLVYATYLGGINYDFSRSITADGSGAAYVTGYTWASDFPVTAGAWQTTFSGDAVVFVSKLSMGGTVATSTPTPAATLTLTRTPTITLTPTRTATPTRTPKRSVTPTGATFTPTRTPTLILTPSRTPTTTSTLSATFTPTPAATTYTISGRITNDAGAPIPDVFVVASYFDTDFTDSNGFFEIAVTPGTYTLLTSKDSYTFVPSPLTNFRTVPVSTADVPNQNFKGYDRSPIVFVHGWHGQGLPFPPCVAEDQADPDSYFQSVDSNLDDSRYYIEYAKLESSRCYTPPITYNVEKLKAAIVLAKNATGQGQVILIAHSMGGVVSRAYLEGPDYAGDVAALFTFGSPHEGIPEGALVQWINLFTASGIGSTGLSLYCATFQPAMCDLSTTGMFVFNSFLSGGKPADMTYHLVSGNAPLSSRNFAGLLMNQFYLFTPNDGIIPTGSGKADQLFAGLDIDRHETDETHGPGTGVFGPNTYFVRENNDPIRSYEECLKPVLADRTSATCMTIASAQTLLQVAFAPAKHASSQLMAQAVSVSPQRTTVQYATLSTGQSATRTIYLEGGPATFVSYWQASTLAVTLIDPNGQMIDPAFAAEHPEIVSYTADSKGAIYSLVNAIPGAWQLVAQATSTPAGGIGYANFAVLESDVSMTGEVNRRWYAPGDSATISATLSGLPTNTAITAKIFRADGAIDIVSFSPLGAGQYAGTYVIPNVPGYAEARLFATGVTARGVPFERETSLLFQISPDSFALNGMYSDAPQPRPFNPLRYQALTVAVGVNATVSGAVGLSADLVDTGGNPVAHAVTIQEVTPGSVTLNLRFDGDDIFASQRDGPYTLTNLLLLDMRSAALVAANAENVHTTTAYHWQDFGGDDAPDTQAGAIQVSANNTNLRYYIAPVGDEDWFRFRLNGIGNPQVHLTSLPANYDLYVYDAEGRLLGSSNKGGKAAELVVVSRALPGDYYVRVVGVNGESDERNPYQLRFNVPGTGGP